MVAGSFAARVLAAVALGRLRRRHAYRYRPPEPGRDLTPEPLRPTLRHLARVAGTADEAKVDDPGATPAFPFDDTERRQEPGSLETGARNGATVTVELTDLSGIALCGSSTDDIARALVAGLLVRAEPGAVEVLLTTALADRLLPGLGPDRAIRRAKTLHDVARAVEAERMARTRRLDAADAPTPPASGRRTPRTPYTCWSCSSTRYPTSRADDGRRCSLGRAGSGSPWCSSTTAQSPPAASPSMPAARSPRRNRIRSQCASAAPTCSVCEPTRPSSCSGRPPTPTERATTRTRPTYRRQSRPPSCTATATSMSPRRRPRPLRRAGPNPASAGRERTGLSSSRCSAPTAPPPSASRSPPGCGVGRRRSWPGACSAPRTPPSSRSSTRSGPTPRRTGCSTSSGTRSTTCAPTSWVRPARPSTYRRRSASITGPTRRRSPAICGTSKVPSPRPPEPPTTSRPARHCAERSTPTGATCWRAATTPGSSWSARTCIAGPSMPTCAWPSSKTTPAIPTPPSTPWSGSSTWTATPRSPTAGSSPFTPRIIASTRSRPLGRSSSAASPTSTSTVTTSPPASTVPSPPPTHQPGATPADPAVVVSWPTVCPGLDTPARVGATCVLAAGVDVAIVWRFGWSAPVPAYCYFGAVAAVASVSDVASRRIPDRAVLPAYLIGPALLALASAASGSWWPLARAGIAMALLAGFYLTLGLAFPAGMGLGDLKWAGVVGLYLGWLGWSAVSTGTLLAFTAAAVVAAVRRVAISQIHERTLPMAPFMTGGALVAMFAVR